MTLHAFTLNQDRCSSMRPASVRVASVIILGLLAASQSIAVADGGLSQQDLDDLKQRATEQGWTFIVKENPATQYDLSDLTGVVVPENWREGARFDPGPPMARGALPSIFDWRNRNGADYTTDIRNQGGCGSCWAFAVLGSMECGLKARTGTTADLSEQWLVSCCGLGGCGGEWPGNAADMLMANPPAVDQCGDSGAVYEADSPYQATDAACACPYDHPYTIDNWAFIGPQWGTPTTEQLKAAIMQHGPITVCVYADSAFMSYGGGVFNASTGTNVNHAVVLVGWDDSQGEEGVWFMRNSWGPGWGEGGYMRIAYDTSLIGYNALYLDMGPMESGACCFGGGCLVGPESTCDNVGGTFLGAGTGCGDDACAEACDSDIDGNGAVEANDLLALIAAWGCTTCDAEDVDGDGLVGTNDILTLIAAWGNCN